MGHAIIRKNLYGFLPKVGVVDAGHEIQKANSLIELDLKDAFHQLKRKQIYKIFRRDMDWNKEQAKWFASLCAPQGVAQMGNPIVPLLFNMYIGKVLDIANRRFKKAGITAKAISYADDVMILNDEKFIKRKKVDTIEAIFNSMVKLNKKKTAIKHRDAGFIKLGLTIHNQTITSARKYNRLHMIHSLYNTTTTSNKRWGHMEWCTYPSLVPNKALKEIKKKRYKQRFNIL